MSDGQTTAAAHLRFRFASPVQAEAVLAALGPENPGHCRMRLEDAQVVVEVDAARIGSLTASVDDVLACASAAVRSTDAAADRALS